MFSSVMANSLGLLLQEWLCVTFAIKTAEKKKKQAEGTAGRTELPAGHWRGKGFRHTNSNAEQDWQFSQVFSVFVSVTSSESFLSISTTARSNQSYWTSCRDRSLGFSHCIPKHSHAGPKISRVSICIATQNFVLKGLGLPAMAEKYIVTQQG